MSSMHFLILSILSVVIAGSSDLCLPSGIPAEQRRALLNITGGDMPVGILSGNWPSAPLLSELVKILLQEVIGYHAEIDERKGDYGGSPIYGLAGCINFNEPTDKRCGEEETRMHVSTDSWVGGYLPDFEQMQKDFPEIAPIDLGSVGYDGEETMYVSTEVFDAAYSQSGLILDHHKGYNRSHHNAKMFFDSVADIQLSDLKNCSSSELNNPARIEPYARFSGDQDGVVDGGEGLVAKCPDNYWWISPACRNDVTQCIPLITGGNGWRIQALMQWAAAYEMPVAVAVAKAWDQYVSLISTKKVLFYWWVPDSTFIQQQPHQVHFPRNNPKEWAAGDKKTSLATSYISNMVSADLSAKASKVRAFMSNVRFSLLEVQDMLLETSLGGSNYDVACKWIRDNTGTWSEWVPVDTNCQEGFGMVDSNGQFVYNRSEASACGICTAGTFSEEFTDDYGKSFRCSLCPPGYSQPNTYSTKCEPCARGMISNKNGSTTCIPCGVGEYQPLQAQTSCLLCAEIRTTQLLGATSQQDCVCKIDHIEDLDSQCVRCLEGILCPLGSTIAKLLNSSGTAEEPRVASGYSSEASAPLNTYLCPEAACPGGAPGKCAGGLTGATCAKCPEGEFFAEDVGACASCSDVVLPAVLSLTLIAFALGLAISYYLLPSKYRAAAAAGSTLSSMSGLTVATFQVLGVLGTAVEAVSTSHGFPSFTEIFVLNGDILALSCAGSNANTFAMTAVVFWMIPCWLALCGALSQLLPKLKQRKLVWEWRRTINLMGTFFQMAFTTMASLALVPFMCFKHPIGKSSVLKYPDIFCGSAEHSLLHWFGGSLIFLGSIFVSLCAVGAFQAPAWTTDSRLKRRLEMLTFLMHRFRPDSWWFGLVVLAKGTAVSLPAVFFADNPEILILFMLIVLQLYLCVLMWCMPWKTPLLNFVDATITGLLMSLLAVFLSAGARSSSLTDGLQMLVSVLIFGVLIIATLVAGANGVFRFYTKSPADLWLVNMGKVPSALDIFIGLEDVSDYMKSQGEKRKEQLVQSLQQLSAYDMDAIMKSISVIQDDLAMESRHASFSNRINNSQRITSFAGPGANQVASPGDKLGDRGSTTNPTDTDPAVDATTDGNSPLDELEDQTQEPSMQEEMYDNPEGKQVMVSHIL